MIFSYYYFIIVFFNLINSQSIYQASFVLSEPANQYVPANQQAQYISSLFVDSGKSCAIECSMNAFCRVFDYGVIQTYECRLFEGDTDTLGSIISSSMADSIVGTLQMISSLFNGYGENCSSVCMKSRYLVCGNKSVCECLPHSYWDASVGMCLPQITIAGVSCQSQLMMCREDLDLICTGANKCGTCSTLFLNQVTYSSGLNPMSLVISDLDNDNKPDIVVTNYGSHSVGILFNTGTGLFSNQIVYPVGAYPTGLGIANVNNDNKPDIVVSNAGSNNVGVLLNAGNGTFFSQVVYPTGNNPVFITLSDINNDSKPDIIVPNQNSNYVAVLLNRGDGTFDNQITFPAGTYPFFIETGDVNNDNRPDIIVTNYVSNNVGILLNEGNGTFSNQLVFPVDAGPYEVMLADVNNDNRPDIITANCDSNTISVLLHC